MKAIIYGVGRCFDELLSNKTYVSYAFDENNIDIIGIADGAEKNWGTTRKLAEQEHVVKSIDEYDMTTFDKILVTSRVYFEEIKKNLIKKGIREEAIKLLENYVNECFYPTVIKYGLSLVLIIKNEAAYVEEWITYHNIKGVEHFYIYDDGSTDGLKKVLMPYISEGLVTYHEWEHERGQEEAYFHAVSHYKNETRYMGFIDTDEFLVSVEENLYCAVDNIRKKYVQLQEFYHPREQYFGGIGVNFRYFGTSGHKEKPEGLVTENYVYHANDYHPDHSFIKSIVNPRVVVTCGVHHMEYIPNYVCISENGSVIPKRNFMDMRYDMLWINHYWCRSEEELYRKFERGWLFGGHRGNPSIEERRSLFEKELENVSCFNEVYDDGLLKYSDKIKAQIHERRGRD